MLLLKHGSMWLVMFLLLGVRNSDSAETPGPKQEKSAAEEVRDSGGGTSKGLLQYQADAGGYKNNSETTHPTPQQNDDLDTAPVTEISSSTTITEMTEQTKPEPVAVESSTHQEEMTFGEEFDEHGKTTVQDDHTDTPPEREVASGSTVFEVVAEGEESHEESNVDGDFPHDIVTGESNHDAYNDDSILYFESKRYKGNKKKNQNSKHRETGNSITERTTTKERVHVTSYVADITEVDGKEVKSDEKQAVRPPPRDATTISTFFIAPKETVSRRTPIRIRKKIIKPVRLAYRQKQNPSISAESQTSFRQKVPLVEPPSRNNKDYDVKEEINPVTTTDSFNIINEELIDTPVNDKKYLPIRQSSMEFDSGPYVPPYPSTPVEIHLPDVHLMPRVPEQYLREVTNIRERNKPEAILPTVIPANEQYETLKKVNDASVGTIHVLSQNIAHEYGSNPLQVNYLTSRTPNDIKSYDNVKLNEFDSLAGELGENKNKIEKPNFEETNRAEDGLTSSDTILAPIQAAVSLSNHVHQEVKKKPVTNTIIEQQEIRVEPVLKTTIEIQKSIPFEIKEIKSEYNQINNYNPEYEKPVDSVPRPVTHQNDFLQQVALAYHKMSNNGEYQTNSYIPQTSTHQTQPQSNYMYFYRNRLPHHTLYFLPVYNKGVHDFNKGNVGPYIMQQSYKNLGFDHHPRQSQYQGLKYQGVYPSLTRPLPYSNFYDFSTPLLYQPNGPLGGQHSYSYHKNSLPQIRVNPIDQNQHSVPVRVHEENTGLGSEEEIGPSTEETIDSTEEGKQGSDIHIQEAKQEIIQDLGTEPPSALHHTLPQPHQHITIPQHATEPPRPIPNNQPYPYGYSFIYPVSTIDFRSQNPYINYNRRGKAPPFRPSHPMYTSQYPPHTYIVATTLPDRGINARSINHKKLCIEYGGFKPPLVPSIQIDEEFEKEAQDKKDE